jgi:hypothetical protein
MGSQDWEGFQVANLLNHCPRLRAFVKLADMNADFWHGIACTTSCLTSPTLGSFTSLKTVLWACSPNPATVPNDALRLTTLLRYAPNLVSLLIRNSGQTSLSIRLPSNNPLTKLTSLYYHLTPKTLGRAAPLCLRHADMPNLSYITAGLASFSARDPIDDDEDRSSILSVFGTQLRVINLFNSMPSVSGGIVHDIRTILRRCPNLHTFCFNVCPTVLPPENGVLHRSLVVIVLRITDTPAIRDEEWEQFLRAHIKTIMGEAFPALRRVQLHVIGRPAQQFYPACRDLLKRFPKERIEGTTTTWES